MSGTPNRGPICSNNQFCTIKGKRLIMIQAGILMKNLREAISKACKPAVAGVSLAAALSMAGHAYAVGDNTPKLTYSYDQNNIFHPSYDIAVKFMDKMFVNTQYDPKSSIHINPMIGLAEPDLNGDKIPDLIAFPVESDGDNPGELCSGEKYRCPFYIIDVGAEAPHELGIIFARAIDLGDDIVNGYWTLKVFKEDQEKTDDFEVYAYDPAKKKYEPKIENPKTDIK